MADAAYDQNIPNNEALYAQASDALAGVQEAPTPLKEDEEPPKIEESDLLRYQLLGQKLQKADLLIEMYQRELQRAVADKGALAKDARIQAAALQTKYGLSLVTHLITDDGYIIPRKG